jgi:predicted RNA-binding protein (virulence factor B family)
MTEIGKFNILKACRAAREGTYLCDEEGEEVLLPAKEEPEDLLIGDQLRVFVYRGPDDKMVATLKEPKVVRNEFAYLQVVEVTRHGAFLDWGLDKDLLLPFSEQARKMKKGEWCLICLYLDEQTDRLVASARIQKFLDNENLTVRPGDEVNLLIGWETDLGFNVIINNRHQGLLFHKDLFKEIHTGDRMKGYIHQIKPDNKIDVGLQKPGYGKVPANAQKILDELKQHNGFLPLTDKSPPELIRDRLGMSKKTFKKAVGGLYKQRLISIEADGIYLL